MAYYHLPGLFEFYELYKLFLPLFYTHREYFYDWCEIGSIYGAPEDCLWGGGRVGMGEEEPEEVLALTKEYGISARLTFSNSLLRSLSFFLSLRSIVFSGYIGRTIVNLSSCSILVYTIHYPILSLLYMKTDLFVHTVFFLFAWAGLLLLWFFISYWVYQIPYISSFLRI